MSHVRTTILTAAALFVLAPAAFSQTSTLTLEWDRNPEPEVIGYRVYAGTEPGVFTEQFDAGSATRFVYRSASPGVRYYFAVAAYTAGSQLSAKSNEVSGIAGAVSIGEPIDPSAAYPAASPSSATSNEVRGVAGAVSIREPVDSSAADASLSQNVDDAAAGQEFCLTSDRAHCYAVEAIAPLQGAASDVSSVQDGSVLTVEGGQVVRAVSERDGTNHVALVADRGTAFGAVRVAADYATSGHVYVSQVRATRDGARELDVVRYRAVRGVLAEAAAVVAGVPVPAAGAVPFAVAPDGSVYVAVPADADSTRPGPFSGLLLRFNADGRAAGAVAPSPVLAQGFERPSRVEIDAARHVVWLAGSRREWEHTIAFAPMTEAIAATWPPPAIPASESMAPPASVLLASLLMTTPSTITALDPAASGILATLHSAETSASSLVRLRKID